MLVKLCKLFSMFSHIICYRMDFWWIKVFIIVLRTRGIHEVNIRRVNNPASRRQLKILVPKYLIISRSQYQNRIPRISHHISLSADEEWARTLYRTLVSQPVTSIINSGSIAPFQIRSTSDSFVARRDRHTFADSRRCKIARQLACKFTWSLFEITIFNFMRVVDGRFGCLSNQQ